MTTQEVISCCPWRLERPRPLTQYEWTVVENAVHAGVANAQGMFSAQTKAMAVALTMAISQQVSCPNWTHSDFGPSPAVSTFAYGCLGSWWGSLDYASQQRALADIHSRALLCSPSPPWAACPIAQYDMLYRPVSRSEYGEQRGILVPGAPIPSDPCLYPRFRTVYTPVKGSDIVELMKMLGGGIVPPQVLQLVQAGGAMFADRSFVIGWQSKTSPNYSGIGSLNTFQDVLRLMDGMIEDVVLVWAPGQGMSIRDMLVSGSIDPAKLLILMQNTMPSMVGDLLRQLPGWLQQQIPGLLATPPPIPGIDWGGLLGGLLGGSRPQQLVEPNTPPSTGLRVTDNPSGDQDQRPLTTGPATQSAQPAPSTAAVKSMDTETMLLLGAVGFGIFLIWRGYRTR